MPSFQQAFILIQLNGKTGQVQYLIAVAKCVYVFQPFAGWQEVLRGREFADHCREGFAAD